jgi:hypothetical protein
LNTSKSNVVPNGFNIINRSLTPSLFGENASGISIDKSGIMDGVGVFEDSFANDC